MTATRVSGEENAPSPTTITAEPKCHRLQSEDDEHQSQFDQPDATPNGMAHQAQAHGGRAGFRFNPDALENGSESVDEGGGQRKYVERGPFVVGKPPGMSTRVGPAVGAQIASDHQGASRARGRFLCQSGGRWQ
jgi:hypothetical protein